MPKRRLSDGFTLSYTLFLALFFAALFSVLTYFSFTNLKFSSKSYASLQAKYLAESANARALALMNTRTMPDTDVLSEEDDDFDDDFDDFDDEDEDEEDFDEDEDDFFEESILEVQPRYINYVTDDLYFVNIQTGEVVNQEQYTLLLAEQKNSRANRPPDFNEQELDVKDLYLPLPEVNVSYVGLIKIPEKSQLRPGFELKIADKIRVDIKQDNILSEYLGLSLKSPFGERKPILRSISPNYAYPGDLVDIFVDGEYLNPNEVNFSSSDFEVIDISDGASVITVSLKEEIKQGTYTLNISGKKIDFYVAPSFDPNAEQPELYDIFIADEELGFKQMTEIFNSGTFKDLKLNGRNLVIDGIPPIIVSDINGVKFDIKSFNNEELIFNLEAKSLPANNTFSIKVITAGGESNSWLTNIKQKPSGDEDLKPFTGIYSTRLRLLQANSLSNLPWNFDDDFEEERDEDAPGADQSGRPQNARDANAPQREFSLINSDLETVWLLESIATVNGYTYKESAIVRRTVPRIAAPLITNTEVRFGAKDFKIRGSELAKAELNDSVSKGDTYLEFINEFPPLETEIEDPNTLVLDGSAVVEDLDLGSEAKKAMSPEIIKFESGSLVSVVPSGRFETVSDFAIIKEIKNESIILEDPGFKDIHFIRDNLVQFIPAVIGTETIDERSAKRHLEPQYAWLELENISGFQNLENLLFADIPTLNYFKRDLKTQFPGGYIYALDGFNRVQVEEYFEEGEYFGLNIIQGEVTFTKTNPIYGQGILIIDTTEGGRNPQGGTVRIEGSSKNQSEFKGLIYIIGDLEISGTLEMQGAIIVKSPQEGSTSEISADGSLTYDPLEISKTMFDLPFIIQPGTRNITRMKKHEFEE